MYFFIFFDRKPLRIVYYLYCSQFICKLALYTIFNIEMLEKLKFFQSLLRNEHHELSSHKIFTARLLFFLLIALLSTFLSDIRKIYSVSGAVINSLICLVIPGWLGIRRDKGLKNRDSWISGVLDMAAFGVGIFTIVLYLKETLFK